MAITNRERQFLIKLKEEGVSKEEATWRLRDVRIKLKEQQVPVVEETEVVETPEEWEATFMQRVWWTIAESTVWDIAWWLFEWGKQLLKAPWEIAERFWEVRESWVERQARGREEFKELTWEEPTLAIPSTPTEAVWIVESTVWAVWIPILEQVGKVAFETIKWTLSDREQQAFSETAEQIKNAAWAVKDFVTENQLVNFIDSKLSESIWEEKWNQIKEKAPEIFWEWFWDILTWLEATTAIIPTAWLTKLKGVSKKIIKEWVEPTKGLTLWKQLPEKIIASVQKMHPRKIQDFVKMTKWKSPEEWLNERWIIQWREDTIAILWQRWLDAKNEIDTWIAQLWWKFKDKNVSTMLKQSLDEATETWDDIRKKLLKKFTDILEKIYLKKQKLQKT